MKARSIVLVFAVLAVQMLCHAQAAIDPESPHGAHILTLDVAVTDKSGQPVSGLNTADFTLLDNKQPQTLLSVRAEGSDKTKADPPIEVILLIDAVNMPASELPRERQQLTSYFQQNGGELALPTSLVILTDEGVRMLRAPTRSGTTLARNLDAHQTGIREIGRSAQDGGVERRTLSLTALAKIAGLERTRSGRKLLIWISSGWPSLSRQSFITASESGNIFHDIVGFSRALRDARITLYGLDATGIGQVAFGYTDFMSYVKGVDSPGKADYADMQLPVLAIQTGGRLLYGSTDLSDLIEQACRDARSYYVLSYQPRGAEHTDEFHAIKVSVDRPGLAVRTRTGYYAQP